MNHILSRRVLYSYKRQMRFNPAPACTKRLMDHALSLSLAVIAGGGPVARNRRSSNLSLQNSHPSPIDVSRLAPQGALPMQHRRVFRPFLQDPSQSSSVQKKSLGGRAESRPDICKGGGSHLDSRIKSGGGALIPSNQRFLVSGTCSSFPVICCIHSTLQPASSGRMVIYRAKVEQNSPELLYPSLCRGAAD